MCRKKFCSIYIFSDVSSRKEKTVLYFKPLGFYAPDLTFPHTKKCSLEMLDYIEISSFPLFSPVN